MSRNAAQTTPVFLCALAALVMAYGWGYRGIVGHEGGAMVPGAMLGLAVCLGSTRPDWHRRAAVAGLFGAVGWAWGGTLSYMEQTAYTVTDSWPDVLYGYTILFFLGALWAGIGGAVLGWAFTMPRSRLGRFTGPFAVISAAFLATYLGLLFAPEWRDAFDRFTAEKFHDADWFPALTVIVVSGIYVLVRRKERAEALLFLACGAAWWIGYLAFTKFGGLNLAPPYRSEGWGGVLGILAVLIVYLVRQRNRAALMLCRYGMVGGGMAFAAAVFIRHPIRVGWGPFASWNGMMQWKIAEESFGLLTGLAIALGVCRLARGNLAAPEEDESPTSLDVFSVFVILIALMWINLRRAPMGWIERYKLFSSESTAILAPRTWFLLGGAAITAVALYGLYRYRRNALAIAPSTPYGKGALVLILLIWMTVIGGFVQQFPEAGTKGYPLVDATFVAFASLVTAMLLSRPRAIEPAGAPPSIPPSDPRWNVGLGYAAVCICAPVLLVVITALSMAMQNGPASGARFRFGPDAYWRQALGIMGCWRPVAPAPASMPFETIEFKKDRSVEITVSGGRRIADMHSWHHADSLIWLEWYARKPAHPEHATVPLTLKDGLLHMPIPPANGTCTLEKVGTTP